MFVIHVFILLQPESLGSAAKLSRKWFQICNKNLRSLSLGLSARAYERYSTANEEALLRLVSKSGYHNKEFAIPQRSFECVTTRLHGLFIPAPEDTVSEEI